MAVAPAAIKQPVRFRRFRLTRIERRNLRWGLLFISPWLFGFIVFGVFPILYTFYLSLTRYSGIMAPVFIGIGNYQRMANDPLFLKSAYNTLYYTAAGGPDRGRRGDGAGDGDEPPGPRGIDLPGDLLPALDPAGLRHLLHLRRPAEPGLRTRQLGSCRRSDCRPRTGWATLPTPSSPWS